MPTPLKIVLTGCGGMSEAWLKTAVELPDVELVGLVDIAQAAAERRKEQFGLSGARVGTDLAAMLDQTKPDIVFDVTIPEAHLDVTLTALAHGCHVLGEKPMANSMANARAAVAAAAKSGKLYAVIQNRRYSEPIRRIKAFLETGELGELTTINCDFYIGAHFGGFRDHMEHVLLLDMAVHTFDEARFLCGTQPRAVAYAREWNPAGSWYDHGASAQAVFEMRPPAGGSAGPVVVSYRGSWCAEGLHTNWDADWRIIGTRGTLRWDGADQIDVEVVEAEGGFHSKVKKAHLPTLMASGKTQGHRSIIAEFVDCVRSGAVPETVCSDNVYSLAMVFGAIQSAQTGGPVLIDSMLGL